MKAATGAAGRAATPGDTGGGTAPGSRRQMMRAIVQDGYGSADVLHLAEIGLPAAADGEVLLRVHAAGLDRGTWHLMAGQPYVIRLVSGLRAPKNPVPGLDVAGTVVAAGADVTGFAVGEEVFGSGQGSFAEYARARQDKLARKPARLTFGQAAVLAVSGLTALQGLRDAGRLQPGQHVLITGASGGVGTFAVQIAKALGAQVTGVCSTAKTDLVTSIGVGGMALNARYLQKSGVETNTGVAAVGVNSVAGAIVHLALLVVFFAWSGHGLANAFKLPSSSKLLLILAIIVAIVGIVLATRPGRRFAAGKLIPGLKSAAASLRRVARNPVKMLMLFGESVLITLAYVGALAASVQAFGGGPGVILIAAVYMGAAAIAAAAPSPGGLGAIEAALVAGLTGVGMQAGPAVSAVVLYRLATYWLPVAPGWLSWRALVRRGYV